MDERDVLDAEMRRYYAERAPEYDDWYDRSGRYDEPATNAAWLREVAALERVADGFGDGALLDLACGTGRWTVRFAANPRVTSVTALDQAPAMLAQTRARLDATGRSARLVQGDAYHLPFADAAFASCFFGFFLSHVPVDEVAPFFAEVRRVLQPGGQVLVFDSHRPAGRAAVEVQQRPLKDGSQHRVLKVYYTAATLEQALRLCAAPATIATRSTGHYFVVGQAAMPAHG
jgi:demethylmenaquinone methyltransferase/2-methoxy-6-polyprenyl-1,4-benzoquinol methylase